ncbi:MAG: hypothetical protein SPG03_00440 [Veillonella caviae]|uniref:hypothetical protein n=1 Tax=Veillonella caviae TaxID=248316 RepID=UPI002A916216|nr:hypothetical protein [Veillonella caviae]MDY5480854.1 hypothetical protein [Veillonella caviae]
MEDMKRKEMALLKQLPAQRRIELLEDRVIDLENLIKEINRALKELIDTDINKIFS